jgi:hypothetical protein
VDIQKKYLSSLRSSQQAIARSVETDGDNVGIFGSTFAPKSESQQQRKTDAKAKENFYNGG